MAARPFKIFVQHSLLDTVFKGQLWGAADVENTCSIVNVYRCSSSKYRRLKSKAPPLPVAGTST